MSKHAAVAQSQSAPRSRTISHMPNPSGFLWGFQGFGFVLQLIVTAFLVVAMSVNEAWYSSVFAVLSASYITASAPNLDHYQSFGLTIALWKRHALFAMAIVAVFGITFAVVLRLIVGGSWWITVLYMIGVCIALAAHWFSSPTAAMGPRVKETLADVGKIESAPPVRTLVTVPLLRAWLKMWAVAGATTIAVIGLGYLVNREDPLAYAAPGIWVAMMLGGNFVWLAIGASFAQHLALGGTRKQWVNHYFLTSLINPALMAGLTTAAWQLSDHIEPSFVALMMCFALWIPALFSLLEFTEFTSWWISLPFLVAAVALGIAAAAGIVSSGAAVILSVIAYAFLYFYLRAMCGRFSPYSGGMSRYLGMSK